MAITRRQFLTRTGALTAGSLLGPGLFGNMFVRQAMANIGNKFFVVIFLDGGNDGLNTVTPMDNGSGNLRTLYDGYRRTNGGGINLSPGVLAATQLNGQTDPATGAHLALHPGFGGLKSLWNQGRLAVIQGCGYPDYSLSHEESRAIWQTANPLGIGALSGTGWVGRHLIAEGYGGADVPGVTIDSSVAAELRQSATSVLAINDLEDFGFPYDDFHIDEDQVAKREAFRRLYQDIGAIDPQLAKKYIGNTGIATLLSSESYPTLHDTYVSNRSAFNDAYDALDFSTARDLREIAKIIYGVKNGAPNVNAHFFQLSNGGYDTHSDQGAGQPDGSHYELHKEIGDSLKLFFDDLSDMGAANDVCVLVWSEFSRRIPQNDNGTDHGSQGPMFIVGGGVNGGIYGNHPDIGNLDDDENTPYSQAAVQFRSTDFRDVYGTVLKRWFGMTPANIHGSVLPLDAGDPADFWTVANFDMGFLP
jgi:uncharacterized protein (DUF1501 family)